MLKKLEDNVESEMDNWQKIVERTQRELKEVAIEIDISHQMSINKPDLLIFCNYDVC